MFQVTYIISIKAKMMVITIRIKMVMRRQLTFVKNILYASQYAH